MSAFLVLIASCMSVLLVMMASCMSMFLVMIAYFNSISPECKVISPECNEIYFLITIFYMVLPTELSDEY